jgi:hypothetical protein
MLCEFARIEDTLTIIGAGITRFRPGASWSLAGVVDSDSEVLRAQPLTVTLTRNRRPVKGVPTRVLPLDSEAPGDANVRLCWAVTLPDLADIEPGMYAWRIDIGGQRATVPFLVDQPNQQR